MGFRNQRPSPPRPATRGHKDVSGLAGAIGGMLGGAGDAASAGASSGAMAGGQAGLSGTNTIANPDEGAGAGGLTGAKGGIPSSSGSGVDYSSLIAKPGFWQNLLSKGGAGINYQNLLGQLANTQLSGQNQLATGAQQQQATAALSSQQADQIKQQTLVDAENRVASADGIDVNDPQAMQDWRTQTQHGRALNAGITTAAQGNMATLSKNASDPTQNPMAQLSTNLGFNAQQGLPAAKFADLSRMNLNPGQTATQSFGPGTPWQTGTGATGSSNTNSKVITLGPNGMPITTDTATTRAGGGGFNNPNLGASGTLPNLGALAAKANADGTIDDGSNQENDEQVTPAASALQVKPPTSGGLANWNSVGSNALMSLIPQNQGQFIPYSSSMPTQQPQADPNVIYSQLLEYLKNKQQPAQ